MFTKSARSFLAHTLAIADTMLRFEFATRDCAVRLVDHQELLPDMPERTRSARDPFCLRVTVRQKDIALTIPVVRSNLDADRGSRLHAV